ncbi:spore coat protein SP60 [Aplysia californica]|uniref:Spore coat protein SP60 n=1 Tax=Aplysia californica TaxID=6500 RepID=A0ABM1W205_APLCA|nr:spore coat protein SP60 [Aplysia californica]
MSCPFPYPCEPPKHRCVPACTKQCREGFKCEHIHALCLAKTCPLTQTCTDLRPNTCGDLQCPAGKECKMVKSKCSPDMPCEYTEKAECLPAVCSRKCYGARNKCKLVTTCPFDGTQCTHRQMCERRQKPCPKCPPGYECALRKRCRRCRPRPVCVFSQGVCPSVSAQALPLDSLACKKEIRRRPLCAEDIDCKKSRKCCTSKCGRKISQSDVVSLGSAQSDVVSLGSAQSDVVSLGSAQSDVVSLGSAQSDVVSLGSAQSDVVSLGKTNTSTVNTTRHVRNSHKTTLASNVAM